MLELMRVSEAKIQFSVPQNLEKGKMISFYKKALEIRGIKVGPQPVKY